MFVMVQNHGPPGIQAGTVKEEKRAAGWWMPGLLPAWNVVQLPKGPASESLLMPPGLGGLNADCE